jgi:hypothetical protein
MWVTDPTDGTGNHVRNIRMPGRAPVPLHEEDVGLTLDTGNTSIGSRSLSLSAASASASSRRRGNPGLSWPILLSPGDVTPLAGGGDGGGNS